ncbi:CLUMA_CG019793, isoform A [Clunio marinus]|uniref:CLUMA_CG019793, isoform A n=1 Tax=Clunio marinus TaxID=568069 RepID=A0A1J1J4K9_9DIPT|nr:CLUMA_CG019793, isoform A [Clunio marinus]
MKVFIVGVLLVGVVLAIDDKKDSVRSKRDYDFRYRYEPLAAYRETTVRYPITYGFDTIDHPPPVKSAAITSLISPAYHAPLTAAYHTPILPVSKVTSSLVSTNIHHFPSHAPFIASSPFIHAPPAIIHSPLIATFHR